MSIYKDQQIKIEDLEDLLEMHVATIRKLDKQIDQLTAENARLSKIARDEMMAANRMVRIIRSHLQNIDSELTVAYMEIEDAICRDHPSPIPLDED